MKKISVILLLCFWQLFAQKASFELGLIYQQQNNETKNQLDLFIGKLKDALNNYDWEFPLTDFEQIENSITINLEKEESGYNFKGMISFSSGIKQSGYTVMLQKRDVIFSESDISAVISYVDEPDLNNQNINSLENILKFYIFCSLLENFDRLSYTDNDNFYLYGEKYISKLTALTGRANSSDAIEKWEKRKALLDKYLSGAKNEERKLNALIYNARYFINDYKTDRARHFLPQIMTRLEKIPKESQTAFFNSYYADMAELLRLDKEKTYQDKVKKMDPAHAKFYK